VFLHWLVTVFPGEMRSGWQLLRPDLAIWIVVALVTVASPFIVGTTGGVRTSLAGLILSQAAGLLIVVVQSVRFNQNAAGQGGTWSEALARSAARLIPAAFYATLAVLVASGATALVRQSLVVLLRDTPVAPFATACVSAVILVSLLTMFAFVPFFATLSKRDEIGAERLAGTPWLRPFAMLVWPLSASRRATDGRRWHIAPYIVLMIAAPLPAVFAPRYLHIPLVVVLMLVSWTAVAVIFRRYLELRESVSA
jgi:hypothetical protein